MLLKALPHEGFPRLTGLPFDLVHDGWNGTPRYATVRLPDGTLPLFLKPLNNATGFSDFDLGRTYFVQLRPDTFAFAWRTGECAFVESFSLKGVFTSGVFLSPRPTWDQYTTIEKYIKRQYGATIEALAEFDEGLRALAAQWIARERRRQAAGLLRPWTFQDMRMRCAKSAVDVDSPSGFAIWKQAWHPRTGGVDIAREYPADWVGGEPEEADGA